MNPDYGILYLCATPIGNLEDITLRVLKILRNVDLIAAEDTRVTIKLLNHFNIKSTLTSYHEHNKLEKGKYLIGELKRGKDIALVSDAGTPAISDPGEDLLKQCIEEGIKVYSLPGPTALISALTISGISTQRFSFEGFLSTNKKTRKEHLEEIKNDIRTLIFYEAPHKLKNTLDDLYVSLGDRKMTLCRELTKKYEEIIRTTTKEGKELYNGRQPKGEYVIIVEGIDPLKLEEEKNKKWEEINIEDHVKMYTDAGLNKKEAIKAVAKDRNISKRDIYAETMIK